MLKARGGPRVKIEDFLLFPEKRRRKQTPEEMFRRMQLVAAGFDGLAQNRAQQPAPQPAAR